METLILKTICIHGNTGNIHNNGYFFWNLWVMIITGLYESRK